MLLSIVIPVRNTNNNFMDRYLQRLLDEINKSENFDNIYHKFEVIVIDDNSDEPLNPNWGKIQGTIIRNEERKNIGGSRNIGLEKAIGKYIWFFDGDDLILPNTLNKISELEKQLETNDIELILLSFYSLNNNKIKDKDGNEQEQTIQNPHKLELQNYLCAPVSTCCKIIRKDKCVYHPEGVYMEDVIFNFKLMDNITSEKNVLILNDSFYWIYDCRRPSNFTHTSQWLQANKFTIEQHLKNAYLNKNNLKYEAIGDVFILFGQLWNLLPTLKNSNVRNVAAGRLLKISEKFQLHNYTH